MILCNLSVIYMLYLVISEILNVPDIIPNIVKFLTL